MYDELNAQQLEAVKTINGPLLILAGAGTGKTKTLISRMAHIISTSSAFPNEILAVTFTNKAANEMNNRIMNSDGIKLEWMGTFHSIAAKILRKNASLVNLNNDFTILDADDQLRVLKSINSEDLDKDKLKKISNSIQRWKDKGWSCDDVVVKNSHDSMILEYYTNYQKRLLSSNAVDFGDILLYNMKIFNNHPDVLKEYQTKFKYIMVDEYQDTNVIQYLWLRIISQFHKNICCVGDDDQSIYGWRGAEIENILRFSDDFSGAKIVRLEHNYRSTAYILNVASSIISNNTSRLGKKLWTESESGHPVSLLSFNDGRDEARYIVNQIGKMCSEDVSLNEVAVLVRSSAQTRILEESFVNSGVPYRIVGNLRFYDRKEVRDLMSYLRLILNHNDDIAFERIINVPKREIGSVTVKKIYYESISRSISMFETMQLMAQEGMFKRAKSSILEFINNIQLWSEAAKELPLVELMRMISEDSGYMQMLKDDQDGRMENVRELLYALDSFQDPVEFLEHVSLVTSSDNMDDKPMVNVMTLHMAKGLEFLSVFLPGWEEGVFPNQRSINENNGVEEERRLAYVGITRARRRLFISYAKNRFINNNWQSLGPSRFISEIPKEQVNVVDLSLNKNNRYSYYNNY